MKRLIALLLLCTLAILSFVSCFPKKVNQDDTLIRIGVMSGPTGMGMAKLMADNAAVTDKYAFEIYSAPTTATADLIAGDLDMLCLPTNTAANLKNKNDSLLSVIAINTLGSLYLLTRSDVAVNSIADLDGRTVVTSVASSTTVPIINHILTQNGVNAEIEVEADHQALVARLVKNEVEVAILPEPMVTTALTQNDNYRITFNLTEEWDKISDESLAMGCIVVRNDFLAAHKSVVDSFLDEYKQSIAYVSNPDNLDSAAQMIVDGGILPKLPVAKKALANLSGSIVYIDGAEMKAMLESFFSVLLVSMPASIGGKMPAPDFYYEK